jgi:hypothetical protein
MASSPSASEASKLLEAALEQMDGIIQGAKFEIPFQQQQQQQQQQSHKASQVSEALQTLHSCLLRDESCGQMVHFDTQSGEFVFNWLRNNLMINQNLGRQKN